MAELRRQEDPLYTGREEIEDNREEGLYENDPRTNDPGAHDLNKFRPVSSAIAVEDAPLAAPFSNREVVETSPATFNRQPAQDTASSTPLFSTADVEELRGRWGGVQAGFVDEPRHAVQEADKLVAAVVERLTAGFANERSALEKQWDRGDEVSTEDLRLALQRYRAFFGRLLNV
jgi:hypothetical protein